MIDPNSMKLNQEIITQIWVERRATVNDWNIQVEQLFEKLEIGEMLIVSKVLYSSE